MEGENGMELFIPLIFLIGFMYFTVIRPQKQQMNEKQKMIDALSKGDHVVTLGGLHGIVDEVNIKDSLIVIDCEGVYLTFELNAIAKVISQTESNVEVNQISESTETESDINSEDNE